MMRKITIKIEGTIQVSANDGVDIQDIVDNIDIRLLGDDADLLDSWLDNHEVIDSK